MSAQPELPEDVRAMLAADAREIAPPPGAREQVLDRVFTSVGVAAAVTATAGGASAASAGGAISASVKWTLAALALLTAAGATVVVRQRSTARSSAVGRPLTDRLTQPPQRVSAPIERAPIAVHDPTPAREPTSASLPAPATDRAASIARRAERPAIEPEDALEQEQRLLARGQRALAEGRADAVLDAVRAHSQQFARGALAEERDALEVRALLLARRMDEARAKAERFRRRFPDSVFLSAIEGSLREP